mmetsp:Transcript_17942/g.45630  ORF Transcript_17942/g.45630 Transcript_17942/m.45630 type:complete len:168 (-) Transcript_17942:180-683(-)
MEGRRQPSVDTLMATSLVAVAAVVATTTSSRNYSTPGRRHTCRAAAAAAGQASDEVVAVAVTSWRQLASSEATGFVPDLPPLQDVAVVPTVASSTPRWLDSGAKEEVAASLILRVGRLPVVVEVVVSLVEVVLLVPLVTLLLHRCREEPEPEVDLPWPHATCSWPSH